MTGIVLFGIVGTIGAILILLDLAAMANDPTPSLYNSGFTAAGVVMLVISTGGAGVSYLAG